MCTLTVLRAEGRRRLDVRLAEMPRGVVGERIGAEFGFVVRDAERRRSDRPGPCRSVVPSGARRSKAGLQVGDVILQVNDAAVRDP